MAQSRAVGIGPRRGGHVTAKGGRTDAWRSLAAQAFLQILYKTHIHHTGHIWKQNVAEDSVTSHKHATVRKRPRSMTKSYLQAKDLYESADRHNSKPHAWIKYGTHTIKRLPRVENA